MKEKQNDLPRMFQVLTAIEHEDLNNSEYNIKEVLPGEVVDTTIYLGTVEERFLSEGYYIFIWVGVDMEEEDFPTPDQRLHIYGDQPHLDQVILVYHFPYPKQENI